MFDIIVEILKILVLVSVFFVWFIRYDNIVEEFKHYGYPAKLRDLVGILKITSVILIQSQNTTLVRIGAFMLGFLMLSAFITHIKVENKPIEALPSILLFCFSLVFLFSS